MRCDAILFVDDEPVIRRLFVRSLEKKYVVYEADGVDNALEQLKNLSTKIDLIITDMKMPNRDGLALINEVNSLYPKLPVMVCTGDNTYCNFDDLIDRKKVVGVIEKPVTAAIVVELIGTLPEYTQIK